MYFVLPYFLERSLLQAAQESKKGAKGYEKVSSGDGI
jgi:hypothetical protein